MAQMLKSAVEKSVLYDNKNKDLNQIPQNSN